MYLVTLEGIDDGMWLDEPSGFDSEREARAFVETRKTPKGHCFAVYKCHLLFATANPVGDNLTGTSASDTGNCPHLPSPTAVMSLPHAISPCAECPWRTDVPVGKFPPERYIALAATAYDMAGTVFACHMSKEGGEFACAGFILQSSVHNFRCRMARIPFDDVRSPYPLFETYRDLAIANGVDENHPALRNCRDDGQRPRSHP